MDMDMMYFDIGASVVVVVLTVVSFWVMFFE